MFVYFAKKLYTSLMEDNFTLIQFLYDSPEFDNSTKYMGLSKHIGSVLYVVIIVNLDTITLDEFMKVFDDYKMMLEKMNLRNILVYNVLASSSVGEDAKKLVQATEDFFDQQLITMYWAVDTTANSVYSKERDDFIGIKSHIQNSLSGEDQLIIPESFKSIRRKGVSLNTARPVTNKNIVVICLLMTFVTLTLSMQMSGGSQYIEVLIRYGALEPNRVFYDGEYFRIFTTTFLHSGTMHLLFNGLSLYIFGTLAEKYLGVTRFVIIYLFSGLVASLLTLFFVDAVSVGASGAIFGIKGALLAITHKTGKAVSHFSSDTLILYIAGSIAFSFLIPNVGHIAHVSGLIAGYVFGSALYNPLENSENSKH